jgi:hypothetical protein
LFEPICHQHAVGVPASLLLLRRRRTFSIELVREPSRIASSEKVLVGFGGIRR